MGFVSQDDLITQLTVNGKGDTVTTTKTLSAAQLEVRGHC